MLNWTSIFVLHHSTSTYLYIYIYTLLLKKTNYDSYSRFMPLLLASISALYSSLVELQGSNHGRSGEGDITRQLTLMLTRKRAGCNNSLVNPLNGDAALKLKMWIFTDFHPVLLQVGVEMLYLLAILGGFWKLELQVRHFTQSSFKSLELHWEIQHAINGWTVPKVTGLLHVGHPILDNSQPQPKLVKIFPHFQLPRIDIWEPHKLTAKFGSFSWPDLEWHYGIYLAAMAMVGTFGKIEKSIRIG